MVQPPPFRNRSGSALQAQIGTLGQQRDASSTTGNGASSKPKGACWDCGKEGHHKGDPSCPEPKTKTPGATGSKSTKIAAKHGLDLATAQATNKLIYAELEKLPTGTTPADGTEIKSGGEVVAKFCDHPRCKRFTKGSSMHCMATGHGNGTPKAFLGGIPSALKPAPDPDFPRADLSVSFQDPLTTTDPAALMCMPTDPTAIPSVLMAKKPPSYQLGRMTRTPGAFMAFMTSSGHSHSPVPVSTGTPREMSKRKADDETGAGYEAGAEDTDVEESSEVEGTEADLDSIVNTYNLSGSTYEEDCYTEEEEKRDAALNASISAPIWRNPCPRFHKRDGVIQYPTGVKYPKDATPPDDDEDGFYDSFSDKSDVLPGVPDVPDNEDVFHDAHEDEVKVDNRPRWEIKAEQTRSASFAFQTTSTYAFTTAAVQNEWNNEPTDELFDEVEEDAKPAAKPKVPDLNF